MSHTHALTLCLSFSNNRKRNSHFFRAANRVVSILETCSQTTPNQVDDAATLRQVLLSTYTGLRLRSTLDWSWASVDDDVSRYTEKLTELERNLFRAGASASGAHYHWKQYGSRNLTPKIDRRKIRSVTPENNMEQQQHDEKRQKV